MSAAITGLQKGFLKFATNQFFEYMEGKLTDVIAKLKGDEMLKDAMEYTVERARKAMENAVNSKIDVIDKK